MARYQIWDKKSNIITPVGNVFTPEKWIEKHPMAGITGIKFVISGGVINGGFAGELSSMVEHYKKEGCDFSACTLDQEFLDAIEAFEDARNAEAANTVSTEERTAAALEFLALNTLPDAE